MSKLSMYAQKQSGCVMIIINRELGVATFLPAIRTSKVEKVKTKDNTPSVVSLKAGEVHLQQLYNPSNI